jgi:Flp pilus assembly protein TadG
VWAGHAKRDRRGAALVEAAVLSTLFLTLVFGMLELGAVLFRNHLACEAARQGARNAIVHGYLSQHNSTMNAWGPTPTYYPGLTSGSLYSNSTSHTVSADNPSDELAGTIRPYLAGLDPSTVTIQILWPDGNNDPGNRVTVTVTTSYQTITLFIFGNQTIPLVASSTMTIVH